jgi:hypothetical protein
VNLFLKKFSNTIPIYWLSKLPSLLSSIYGLIIQFFQFLYAPLRREREREREREDEGERDIQNVGSRKLREE